MIVTTSDLTLLPNRRGWRRRRHSIAAAHVVVVVLQFCFAFFKSSQVVSWMAGGEHLTLKPACRQGCSFQPSAAHSQDTMSSSAPLLEYYGTTDSLWKLRDGVAWLNWAQLGYAMWAVVIVHGLGRLRGSTGPPHTARPSPAVTRPVKVGPFPPQSRIAVDDDQGLPESSSCTWSPTCGVPGVIAPKCPGNPANSAVTSLVDSQPPVTRRAVNTDIRSAGQRPTDSAL